MPGYGHLCGAYDVQCVVAHRRRAGFGEPARLHIRRRAVAGKNSQAVSRKIWPRNFRRVRLVRGFAGGELEPARPSKALLHRAASSSGDSENRRRQRDRAAWDGRGTLGPRP